MKKVNFKLLAVAIVLLVFGLASPALAHKVYVFAWAEKGMVYTESSFGDKKVIKGKIEVKDEKGTLVASGITDDQGNFSFKIPENPGSDLVVMLDASMGHQAAWTVPLKEMKDAMEKIASKESHDKAMAKKAELEKGPSPMKIGAGIAIIFALAFIGAFFQKIRNKKTHNQKTGQRNQV